MRQRRNVPQRPDKCPSSPRDATLAVLIIFYTGAGLVLSAIWHRLAFVVTEPCFGCKYTDCVVVCPCDCFHEGDQMLFIDPEHCIDCDACVPECPVAAIFYEDDVPEAWQEFIALNREMAATCPPIVERKEPLAGRCAPS
jgi:ferredoxin